MLQTVVKKALAKYDFQFEFAMEHTAAGEVGGFTEWLISMPFQKN